MSKFNFSFLALIFVKILLGFFKIILRLTRYSLNFLKRVFDKKTILLVSKQKIKSYSIGPITQIVLLSLIISASTVFVQSLRYHTIINKKSHEISNLQRDNQQFSAEIDSLNSNLQKINNYFVAISGYKNNDNNNNVDKKTQELFGSNLDQQDRKIANKIASSSLIIDNIKNATNKRIGDLEKKIAITNLSFVDNKVVLNKKSANDSGNEASNDDGDDQNVVSLNNKNDLAKRQGGPLQTLLSAKDSISSFSVPSFGGSFFHKPINDIKSQIEYLVSLEKFVHSAPLSAPMHNYYVSSGFGKRIDPIKGVGARHNGMDFVGKIGEKILSPSTAKVIFAGKFGAYGNMLILDHGYGITTRYGHLSQIHVNKGDVVTKNQVIAIQGTTGRSTGPHLHYEVRYNNIPLNPKKFLQAGQEIFNNIQ